MSMKKSLDVVSDVKPKATRPQTKRPSLFQVLLINDDYTPMDFVVEVLMKFFGLNEPKAIEIMLMVHETGSGVCGIFTRDIAETKVALVNQYARENGHPLLCQMRRAE